VPPKRPAEPQPARVRKQSSRPVPTGASAYVIESRREIGTILGEAGWTQAQLARAIGVKYWTVVRWESGRKAPTQGELDVIARILELSRRGIDPLQITAPDVEALLETPGPAKPRKNRSIPRPDGYEPPTRHFRSVEPRKP
jgi:DNA-binding XRE family transcriptional regulator